MNSTTTGPHVGRIRYDLLIAVVISVLVGYGVYRGAGAIDPIVFEKIADDVWFESDQPRVFNNMTNRDVGDYDTSAVHPLFPATGFLPVKLIRKVFHVIPIVAVRIVSSALAALWAAVVYVVLRLFGCRRFDSLLFTTLTAVSASAVFFLTVPETYVYGSLTILIALGTVLLARDRPLPSLWYVVMSAMALSMTVTNWMAGIFATFACHPWRKSFQITVNALCLVTVLWAGQKILFPSATFFLGDYGRYTPYINDPNSGGPLYAARSFFFHTMVMPEIKFSDRFQSIHPEWPIMITQQSSAGSGGRWGTMAIGLWAVLGALGLWSLFRNASHRPARVVLGLTLLCQFALCMAFGNETFLYGLLFVPLLVILAALSTQTPARPLVLLLALLLIVTAGANNISQFKKATSFLQTNGPPRHHDLPP